MKIKDLEYFVALIKLKILRQLLTNLALASRPSLMRLSA